jgi:predicted alpha/beta-hydrolase family hydrolase
MRVLLLPGFGGTPTQPLLVRLEAALATRGHRCLRAAPPRGRPSPGLEREVSWLEALLEQEAGPRVVVGRSFGGRVALRLAARGGLDACAVLGLPLRPPGKRRPEDEAALAQARCPTLLVQGALDELGPLALVRRHARRNPRVTVVALPGVGHGLGRQTAAALEATGDWLDGVLDREGGSCV